MFLCFTVQQMKMCCFIMKTRTEVPEMASNASNVNKGTRYSYVHIHYLSNIYFPICLSLSLLLMAFYTLVYLNAFCHLTTPSLSLNPVRLKYLGVLILEGFSEVFLILACDSSENTSSHTHTHTHTHCSGSQPHLADVRVCEWVIWELKACPSKTVSPAQAQNKCFSF